MNTRAMCDNAERVIQRRGRTYWGLHRDHDGPLGRLREISAGPMTESEATAWLDDVHEYDCGCDEGR